MKIKQPKDHNKDGIRLVWDKKLSPEISAKFESAQKYIDSECLRYCDDYMPFLTGALKRSGFLGTVVGTGRLVYIAPYARWQNYNNAGKGIQGTANGGLRGRLPFERMKADKKDIILRGAAAIIGGKVK